MSFFEIPDPLDDSVVEALLRGTPTPVEPALTAFVQEVRQLKDLPAPLPSASLATLLSEGFAAAPAAGAAPLAPVGSRWRRRVAGLASVCVAVSATVVSAAAAQALPPAAQHVVAGIVNGVTPFTVPDPPSHLKLATRHHPAATPPTTTPSSRPRPVPRTTTTPAAGPTRVPAPAPSRVRTPTTQATPDPSTVPSTPRVVPPVPVRPPSRGHDGGAGASPTAEDGHRTHESPPHPARPTTAAGSQPGKGSGNGDKRSGHGHGTGGGSNTGQGGDGGKRNGRGGHGEGHS